jgi:hypothetical protein
MTLFYAERTNGDQAPTTVQASMETGRAQELYLLEEVTSVDTLYDAIKELIGDVQTFPNTDGKLTRTLPRQHPFMPWFASDMSFRGVGGLYIPETNPYIPFSPRIDNWCLYNKYEFTVQFQPRPYPVVSDQYIGDAVDGDWFPFENGGTTIENFKYWKEYERFVNLEEVPTSDTVTLQYGNLVFDAIGLPQDARPFVASMKQFLNNSMMKMTWWQVPYTYWTATNSYLKSFRGRVNQNELATHSMGTFPRGSLLYLGCNAKSYTPPLGNNQTTLPGTNIPDFTKYCNIEMQFLNTQRTRGADPLNPINNSNAVAQGHNLQPFLGTASDTLNATFLYAATSPTSGPNSFPLWKSCPMELLWTNPAYVQTITI